MKKSIDLIPRTKKKAIKFKEAGKKLFDYPWLSGKHPICFMEMGWKSEERIYRFPNNYGASVISLPDKQYELVELSFKKSKEWGLDWDLWGNAGKRAGPRIINREGIEKLLWTLFMHKKKKIRPAGNAIMRMYTKKAKPKKVEIKEAVPPKIKKAPEIKTRKERGRILQIFGSQKEASEKTGICQSCLSDVLNKRKRKIAGGCMWRYEEDNKK